MNVGRFVMWLAALAVCASGTAWSATLDGIKGPVLVNRGGGYKRVRGPMILKTGDSVIANPGGSAIVSYADGCNVPVEAGSVVAIAAGPSPCAVEASFKAPARVTGPGGPAPAGVDGTTLVVGAAVVGASAIGAAVLLSRDNDDRRRLQPASPD
jgi:hypothetical protein